MLSLPKKLITVLLYYFFQLSAVEIGRLFDIPRSTIQYRLARYFLSMIICSLNSIIT
ncbi:hypothetical protein [Virgibacillus pantothenticus]|nr:hypothetical protein [Virgibacillus pantothenticus]